MLENYKRLPEYRQYHLHHDCEYNGNVVMTQRGPLIQEYLDRIEHVLSDYRQRHNETLFLRFDLRFPEDYFIGDPESANSYISHFFKCLNYTLQHASLSHAPDLRYFWCREQDEDHTRPHFHCVLLLNANAICALGSMDRSFESNAYDAENLYHRLVRCWAKSLARPADFSMRGLVHICTNEAGDLAAY